MSDYWIIRNVPQETRDKIKKHAKENHMNIAGVIIKLASKL